MSELSYQGIAPVGSGRLTKTDAAYSELRARILDGTLPPGSVLDQDTIASQLGLSTTPVREALRRLESESLVVMAAHREARIATLTREELEDIYDVRLALDPLAARLATEHATDEQIAAARDALEWTGVSVAEVMLEGNRRFHRAIYNSSGNDALLAILEGLWDRSDRYRMALLRTDDGRREADADHQEIFEAFANRDAVLVERLMYEHLARSKCKIAVLAKELEAG
jgi:DNA-binding GntR family transcriptional regulator